MAKTPIVDFKTVSMEFAVEKVLEELLAVDMDNGILTTDLAKAMIEYGYPEKDSVLLSRRLAAFANEMSGTKARFIRENPDTEVKEKFSAVTWVGARVPHEPWNRHMWHLPMWRNVNEVNV